MVNAPVRTKSVSPTRKDQVAPVTLPVTLRNLPWALTAKSSVTASVAVLEELASLQEMVPAHVKAFLPHVNLQHLSQIVPAWMSVPSNVLLEKENVPVLSDRSLEDVNAASSHAMQMIS